MTEPTMIDVVVGEGDDAKTHSVVLPDGYISVQSVADGYMKKELFETEVGRRATSIAETKIAEARKPEVMLKDTEFIATMTQTLGLVPKGDEHKGTPTPEQIASMQADWRKAELDPVTTKLTEATDRFGRLTSRMLVSDIVQAAALAGVKQRFMVPAAEGQDPPIVAMMANVFRFSPEHDRHFVGKGEDGFEITSDAKSNLPFKTPAEFVSVWAGLKENVDFIDTESRRGPNLDDVPGRVSGKDVQLTQTEAADYATYQAAQEKAEKAGGRVVVTGAPSYGAVSAGVGA